MTLTEQQERNALGAIGAADFSPFQAPKEPEKKPAEINAVSEGERQYNAISTGQNMFPTAEETLAAVESVPGVKEGMERSYKALHTETLTLEYPALAEEINQRLADGWDKDKLRKALAETESYYSAFHTQEEIDKMLGRTDETKLAYWEAMDRQKDDAYVRIMHRDMSEDRVRHILHTAKLNGLTMPGRLLMAPKEVLQEAEKKAGERYNIFMTYMGAFLNAITGAVLDSGPAQRTAARARMAAKDDNMAAQMGAQLLAQNEAGQWMPQEFAELTDEERTKLGRKALATGAENWSGWAKNWLDKGAQWAHMNIRPPEGALGAFVFNAIENSGFTLLSAVRSGLGWAAGGPIGGLIMSGYNTWSESESEAGNTFIAAKQKGWSDEDAWKASTEVFGRNLAFLPISNFGGDLLLHGAGKMFEKLAGTVTGTGWGQRFMRGLITRGLPVVGEAVPEGFEELAQDYFQMDALKEPIDSGRLWEAFRSGMAQAVLYSLAGVGTRKAASWAFGKTPMGKARAEMRRIEAEAVEGAVLGAKLARGEIKPDEIVGQDPVVFVPRDALSEEARQELGIEPETMEAEEGAEAPAAAVAETPAETDATPTEEGEEDTTPNEIAIRKSVWDEWAAKHTEEADALKDRLREGTKGVTAIEALDRRMDSILKKANESPEFHSAEADEVRDRLTKEFTAGGRPEELAKVEADTALRFAVVLKMRNPNVKMSLNDFTNFTIKSLGNSIDEVAAERYEQRAKHVSPYKFDKFSLVHVGEGEGNQTEGYGLYYTIDEDQVNLMKLQFGHVKPLNELVSSLYDKDSNGHYVNKDGSPISEAEESVLNKIEDYLSGLDHTNTWEYELVQDYLDPVIDALENDEESAAYDKIVEAIGEERLKDEGYVYTAEIPDSDILLDYDKPLAEQPEQVKKLLEDAGLLEDFDDLSEATGWDLYQKISSELGGDKEASERLNEIGIPGMQNNSTARDLNFVIWNNELIKILSVENPNSGEVENYAQDKTAPVLRTQSGVPIEEADIHELLLTPDGATAFGVIDEATAAELSKNTGRKIPAGEIRLDVEGFLHTMWNKHGEQIKSAKFPNVGAFFLDVLGGYTRIYQGADDSLLLVKPLEHNNALAAIELLADEPGVYLVQTGWIIRDKGLDKKQLLFTRSESLVASPGPDGVSRTASDNPGEAVPNALPKSNSEDNISQTGETVNNSQTTQRSGETVNATTTGWVHGQAGQEAWNVPSIIKFFETANVSTGFHELGHHMLRVMMDVSKLEGASDQLKADVNTILKHAGVTMEEFDNDLDKRIQAHEFFARSWEVYLGTGKAPTPELQGVFFRLHQWFKDVYHNVVEALGIKLSPEMQDVFDRILATPDQTEMAEYERNTSVGELTAETDSIQQRVKELEGEIRQEEAKRSEAGESEEFHQIIGERGAAKLDAADAGTRIDNLGVAREMEQAGKDAKTIWLATGWQRGKEGKWNYDVMDGEIKPLHPSTLTDAEQSEFKALELRFIKGEALTETEQKRLQELIEIQKKNKGEVEWNHHLYTLGDIYDAPELYKAYPELKDMLVSPTYLKGPMGGYAHSLKEINLDWSLLRGNAEKSLKKTLIHEIQHAIQHIEGFANGGALELFDNEYAEYSNTLRGLRENLELWQHDAGSREFVQKSMEEIREGKKTLAQHWKDLEKFYAASPYAEQIRKSQQAIDDLIKERREKYGEKNTPGEIYLRLVGEVQARNAEARMNMTAEERRQKLLSETEDVAREDQIVLMDALGGGERYDQSQPKAALAEMDKRYMAAVEAGDMETAQKIVDARARDMGYISDDEYRMNHRAPNSHDEDTSVTMADARQSDIVPADYWTTPRYYQHYGDEYASFYKIIEAIDKNDRYKAEGKRPARIWMYRAVPKGVKEDSFRNGDWITPSREYAQSEGAGIPGGYRIIAQRVDIDKVWWDANSINEWGYDDGKNYTYKNTKNNRKLTDAVVRDADGNIVPPSKRFNSRKMETFYQTTPATPAQMTESEIDEMTRDQIDAVRKQYKDTPQWMKAPNGKATNLTEKQWLQVRTPAFKAWFGDWEAVANAYPSVVAQTADDAKAALEGLRGKELTSIAENITATISSDGRRKMVSGVAVRKSTTNGFSMADHFTAVANVEKLFANSIKANERADDSGGLKAIEHFSSLIMLQDKPALATFTVKVSEEHGRKIYSIEVMNLSRAEGNLPGEVEKTHRASSAPDVLNIARLAEKFNNASKVVDENGEPLVVYHGTDMATFSEFDIAGLGNTKGTGAFFALHKSVAASYAGTKKLVGVTIDKYNEEGKEIVDIRPNPSRNGNGIYAVFLNLRNPYEYDADGAPGYDLGSEAVIYNKKTGEEIHRDKNGKKFVHEIDAINYIDDNFMDKPDYEDYAVRQGRSQETNDIVRQVREGKFGEGYDGVIFYNIADNGANGGRNSTTVYCAFSPEQIKSATDNRGTFDAGNMDIYHQDDAAIDTTDYTRANEDNARANMRANEAASAVDTWLYDMEDYNNKVTARQYVDTVTKAIRANGGLRLEDFVHELGEELATELRKKWPGLFRNTTQGPQLELDVLTQQLQANGIDLDVQELVDWLQNTLNETPERPVPPAVTPETLDAMMWKAGPEGVSNLIAERKRWLEGQAKQEQAPATAELRLIDQILAGDKASERETYYRDWIKRLRSEKNARIDAEIKKRQETVKALKAGVNKKAALRREVDRMVRQIKRAVRDENVIYHTQQEIQKLYEEAAPLSKSIKDVKIAALRELHEKIMTLQAEGRRELELKKLLDTERINRARDDLMSPMLKRLAAVRAGRGPSAKAGREDTGKLYEGLKGKAQQFWDSVMANTMGANRFFDWLDGANGTFDGAWVRWFVDRGNEATNAELQHLTERRLWIENKAAELKINIRDLAKTRDVGVPKGKVGNGRWTVDELMSIYAGMKNENSRAAILYGNFGEFGEDAEAMVAKCVEGLTDEERAFADAIIEEYEINFDRINDALIDVYNRGMTHEKNYTPIRRLEYSTRDGMMSPDAADVLMGAQAQAGGLMSVEKGFTKSRMEINAENQSAIDLGLFSIWNSQVEVQEHAAAFGGLVRDMRRILMGRTKEQPMSVQKLVKQVHGDAAWKNVKNYFNIMARDNRQVADDVLNKSANWMARNMSRVYLCANLGTATKQFSSFPRFLPYSGLGHLLSAIGQFTARRSEFLKEVYALDPQLAQRQGNLLLNEMKEAEGGPYEKLINIGMAPIGWVDRAASAIGWKAVYDANIAKGLSKEDAIKAAQRAVLLTQPTTQRKDAPRLWQQGGLLRLAMMFTNDCAQTFGINAYDMAAAIRRGDVPRVLYTLAGVTLAAGLMRLLTYGMPDDDDDESWLEWGLAAVGRQSVEVIPILGKGLVHLWDTKGYDTGETSPYLAPFAKLMSGANGLWDNKEANDERAWWNLFEGASLLAGFPAVALHRLRRVGQDVADGDTIRALQHMIGQRVKEKKAQKALRL